MRMNSHYRQALIIWLRFFVDTEEYDRTLPGIERHGEWIPINDGARASREFCRLRKIAALSELRSAGIPMEVSAEAKGYIDRISLESARRELADLMHKNGVA